MNEQKKLMKDLLFSSTEHGGDNVTWKPSILLTERKVSWLYAKRSEVEGDLKSFKQELQLVIEEDQCMLVSLLYKIEDVIQNALFHDY